MKMTTRSILKLFLYTLLLLGASNSYASDTWSEYFSAPRHATPQQSCEWSYSNLDVNTQSLMYPLAFMNSPPSGYICYFHRLSDDTIFSNRAIYQYDDVCPTGYEDDGSGVCVESILCPTGDIKIARPISIDYSTGAFTMQGPTTSIDSCEYQFTSIYGCFLLVDGTAQCDYTVTSTGNESQPTDQVSVENLSPPPQGTPTDSTIDSSSSNTVNNGSPVDNGDGTTTTTDTDSTINTNDAGAQIWEDDNNIYVRSTTGTVTQYDKITTTITNADGSKSEIISIGGTVNTPLIDTTTLNKSNGTAENTTIESTTIDSSSVTYNVYNSSGQLTGSTTTSDGTGSGTGTDDETQEGNCGAPNQPSCEVTLEGSDTLTSPSDALSGSGINEQMDSYLDLIMDTENTDASGNLLTFEPFNLYAGGSCDPTAYSVEFHSATFAPLQKFCGFYDSDVRPIIAFAFNVFGLIGVLGVYGSAMRKT